MDELLSRFLWWLIWFLTIYAVGFLIVRSLLRRTFFPEKSQRNLATNRGADSGKDRSLKGRESGNAESCRPAGAPETPDSSDSAH